MDKLVKGIHTFHETYYNTHRELFQRLLNGQNPRAMFITCSDSRIIPDLFTQSDPGDLFVLRNAGNMIPPYDPNNLGAEAGTIEYAIDGLKIRNIIICGHTRCGAMHALLNPEMTEQMPSVRSWLKHANGTLNTVRSRFRCESAEELLKRTIEQNVLVQLKHVQTHPSVAAAIARGELKLHAWVFQIETGMVVAYDQESDLFRPIHSRKTEQPLGETNFNDVVLPSQREHYGAFAAS